MGAPKKHRRKYEIPKKPYDKSRLDRERKIKQDFGLRRKKEIWKAESLLRSFRERARELQAKKDEKKEKLLFDRIHSMGISCSNLEAVLEIGLGDVLGRRLQTILQRKGMANSVGQARQFIVHGHVFVNGRRTVWPSYIVTPSDENNIVLDPKIAQKIIMGEQNEAQPAKKDKETAKKGNETAVKRDARRPEKNAGAKLATKGKNNSNNLINKGETQ